MGTSSLASSTTTSSTHASLRPLASAPVALSATLQPVSMAPRTARLTASLAGASLAACHALCQLRRPLPPALDSQQAQPRHASQRQFEVSNHSLSQHRLTVKKVLHRSFCRCFKVFFL